MSMLSEIRGAIQDIRTLLQTSLTPDFFNSVKNTSQAITSVLNDPNISANFKGSLEQLNKLLTEANDRGLTGEVVKLTREIHNKLSEVDVPAINNILTNVGDLLEQAKNAQLIDNLVDALQVAKSIGEFAELAKAFSEGSMTILLKYGPYASVLGVALNVILQKYLGSKESKKVKVLQEIREYSAQMALSVTQDLRRGMANDYERRTINLHNGKYDFDPELRKSMIEEREYNFLFKNTVPRLSYESMVDLAALENKLEKLVHCFAETEIKNESLKHYLGYIGKNYEQYWNELLNYIVYSNKTIPVGKPDKPKLSQGKYNYNGICQLYGEKQVHVIMSGLAKNLAQNGGDELYYQLTNSLEDSAAIFLILAQYVSQHKAFPARTQLPKPLVQLQAYFHEKSEEYIKEQWQKTEWPIEYYDQFHKLDDTIVEIIKMCAFAEFCRITAPYFFGLYPVPREIYNGVLDIPKELWQSLSHPIDAVKGLGSLFTKNGWTNIGRSS